METAVEITSFGYLHDAPPTAHLTVDLRPFRDPHVSPQLRYMTADDAPVQAAVRATPGIRELVDAVAATVTAFAARPGAGIVTVASGCSGGRHRAPTFARDLAAQLTAAGLNVTVQHRDLHKPVVQR